MERVGLVDGEEGVEIHKELKPLPNEVVIKKRRYSGCYGTDLDIILRSSGMEAVIITGVTTENCCHATARDALFHNYGVIFLSDATGTFDYPDLGHGAMSAAEVHRASLVILAVSTACHDGGRDDRAHESADGDRGQGRMMAQRSRASQPNVSTHAEATAGVSAV